MSIEQENAEQFGELRGRVVALEGRVDRHENSTTTAQRELRVEMTRSMGELRSEMKTQFAEMKAAMTAVQNAIGGLRDSEERGRGRSSALGNIGAIAISFGSAIVGALASALALKR